MLNYKGSAGQRANYQIHLSPILCHTRTHDPCCDRQTGSMAGKIVVDSTVLTRERANLMKTVMDTLQNGKEAGWDNVYAQGMIDMNKQTPFISEELQIR